MIYAGPLSTLLVRNAFISSDQRLKREDEIEVAEKKVRKEGKTSHGVRIKVY